VPEVSKLSDNLVHACLAMHAAYTTDVSLTLDHLRWTSGKQVFPDLVCHVASCFS